MQIALWTSPDAVDGGGSGLDAQPNMALQTPMQIVVPA